MSKHNYLYYDTCLCYPTVCFIIQMFTAMMFRCFCENDPNGKINLNF